MQFLWRYVDDMVGKGLSFVTIGELMFYTSASLVPLALPLAVLMASLMTYGNLGENYELTALKAAGISLQRIMLPLIVVNLMIGFGAFFFANNILPIANLKMRSLLYDIRKQRPEMQLRPGEFYSGIEGYSVRIGDKHPVTNTLYNILIYDHTQGGGNRNVTRADSGIMKMTDDSRFLLITLYSGESYTEMNENRRVPDKDRTFPHRFDSFGERSMIISLTGFGLERTDESLFRNNYQMMNLEQLSYYKDSLSSDMQKHQQAFAENIDSRNYSASPFANARNLPKKPADTTINYADSAYVMHLYQKLTIKEKKILLAATTRLVRDGSSYINNASKYRFSREKKLNKYKLEWNRKFILAFATFIFLFIGAPLGAIIRKGGIGMPVVISTVLFIFYYIITLTFEKVVTEGKVTQYYLWVPSLVFFVIGVFLTYKAANDSVIMNMDTYTAFFNKMGKKLKLIKKKEANKTENGKSPSVS